MKRIKHTDRTEPADMYGMQTEIIYDDTFLQLVENSVMTIPKTVDHDIPVINKDEKCPSVSDACLIDT